MSSVGFRVIASQVTFKSSIVARVGGISHYERKSISKVTKFCVFTCLRFVWLIHNGALYLE